MSNDHGKGLDQLITQAAKKVGAKKENDICRYLPGTSGGYIHHFTMRKMKTESPEKLQAMIVKHITGTDKPVKLPPKPRAARGSRKRRDHFSFSKQDIDKMFTLAKLANDKEMIRKLTPKKDIKLIKRELLSSIRRGQVDHELWAYYAEAINSANQTPVAQTQNAYAAV
jgi:hypothetical protein